MDRKGQTWHFKSTVLTVFESERPVPGRPYWLHSIVYLEHPEAKYVGAPHKLEESMTRGFESYSGLRRLA